MNLRLLYPIAVALALGAAAVAQDTPAAAPATPPAAPTGQNTGVGQRGARGGMGGGAGMMGRGVEGTVTEAAADHYTVKTYTGDTYTIHYSANTRFMKQAAPGAAPGQGQGGQRTGQGAGAGAGQGTGRGPGGFQGGGFNRGEPIKSTDIKVGDAIAATGEIDAAGKSVGAVIVVQVDPARAKEMEQMAANYGKTWLQGKVTAIDETKVTIMGAVDNAPHTFMADENTVFRKQRDPVTLADIAVGDTVRVDGATSAAGFTATTVNVMGAPDATTTVPRRPRPQ